jgi:hypothetical protein
MIGLIILVFLPLIPIFIQGLTQFFQHRLNLQVFSIKPEVFPMKKLAIVLQIQVLSKTAAI